MLHFLPALQAALSLVQKKGIPGKVAALREWLSLRAGDPLLLEVAGLLETGYEGELLHDEQARRSFQHRCQLFLDDIAPWVLDAVTIVPLEPQEGMAQLRVKVSSLPIDPTMALFDAVRCSRIRVSHYRCFLEAPPDYEADFFIANEIATLRLILTRTALDSYAYLRWGLERPSLDAVLGLLEGEDLIDANEKDAVRNLFHIAESSPSVGEARILLQMAVQSYPAYHGLLERMLGDVMNRGGVGTG
jgi:hypothetical protein